MGGGSREEMGGGLRGIGWSDKLYFDEFLKIFKYRPFTLNNNCPKENSNIYLFKIFIIGPQNVQVGFLPSQRK